jgi:hypothetical protein
MLKTPMKNSQRFQIAAIVIIGLVLFIPSPTEQQAGKRFRLPLQVLPLGVEAPYEESAISQTLFSSAGQVNLQISFLLDQTSTEKVISVRSPYAKSSSNGQFDVVRLSLTELGAPPGTFAITAFISSGLRAFSKIGASFRAIVPRNTGTIDFAFNENKSVHMSHDGHEFFTYSWSRGVGHVERSGHLSTNLDKSSIISASIYSADGNSAFGNAILILRILLTLTFFALIVRLIGPIVKRCVMPYELSNENKNMLTKVFATLAIFSVLGLLVGSLIGSDDLYFAHNGFQLSKFASFSDFRELLHISKSSSPYSQLQSNYPPLALLAFKPLSSLFGEQIIITLLLVPFAASLLIAYIVLGKIQNLTSFLSYCLLTFSCYPIIFAVDRGNSDLVVMPVVLAMLILYLLGNRKLFALVFGILVAFKLYPLFFGLLFLIRRRFLRLLLVSSVVGLVVTFISAALLPEPGISEVSSFINSLRNQTSLLDTQPFLAAFNSSFSSWWHSLGYMAYGDANLPESITNVFVPVNLVLSGVLIIGALAWSLWRPRPISLCYSLALCVMLLVNDLSFDYRLSLFIPSIFLFVIDRSNDKISSESFLGGIFLSGFFLTCHPLMFFEETPLAVGHLLNAPILLLGIAFILLRSRDHIKLI